MSSINRRLAFVQKWFRRGLRESDPVDQFFSFWIALVVAARQSDPFGSDIDSETVRRYMKLESQRVSEAVDHSPEMDGLARRRGTEKGTPILDAGGSLQAALSALAAHHAGGHRLSPDEHAAAVADMLNRVRNNLFHGRKQYDDRDDRALLQLVNPILRDVLRACANLQE
jgi:hypothetical protein